MSDTWQQLKDIKGLLTAIIGVIVGCMVVGGLLMDWRISVNVVKALAAQDLATDSKIVSMDKATATNTSGVAENKEDISGLESRVQLAFAALMGRSVPSGNDD